jgi:hypothetical protein
MRKVFLVLCTVFLASCSTVHLPPGQIKKEKAPGQMKKLTAPGQIDKRDY